MCKNKKKNLCPKLLDHPPAVMRRYLFWQQQLIEAAIKYFIYDLYWGRIF